MDAQKLVNKLSDIFWNKELNDDEVANELLELMDENQEIIQFDSALNDAYSELNIWSRTETGTGAYLDRIADILTLKKPDVIA